jgi:hypothetical protein
MRGLDWPGVDWRVVALALVADYLAFTVLVTAGAAVRRVSMFYALASPVRFAPLAAGVVAGLLAVGRASGHATPTSGARRGLTHGVAVIAVVLGVALAGGLGLTPLWPVVPVGVLAVGGRAVWHSTATSTRRAALAVGTVLCALVLALPRTRVLTGFAVWLAALVPRIGSFALFAPGEFGRGWSLLAVWTALLVLGGILGGALGARLEKRSPRRQPERGREE